MLSQLQTAWETLHPRSFTVALRKQYPDVYEWLLSQPMPFEVKTIANRAYILLNPNQPTCNNPSCENLVTNITRHGWATYCSTQCRGHYNSLKSRNKAAATSQKNWGVDNPMKHSEIKKKVTTSIKLRSGFDHALQSPDSAAKRTQTMLDLYGVEHAAQHPQIQNKMVETYIKNWGVNNPSIRHISKETEEKLNDPEWLIEKNKHMSFSPIAELLGISTSTLSKAFRKFNIMPIRHNSFISKPEEELVEYISSLCPGTPIITSDRSVLNPYELDIYLPNYNLAFEYNGLYYHSEDFGKDSHYHIFKTEECQKKGIKLIHIWENDYLNNKDIIFSKISHLLGHSTAVYGRKCRSAILSVNEAKTFFNKTHIQGNCASNIKVGLFHNDELIAAMSFGKSRFSNKAEWELLRYSTKLNTSVIGGFSKLLSYFIKQYSPRSIISYSDKCWSTGEVYKKNNFKYCGTSKPSYFYSKDGRTIENRMSCQKKKLKNKLAIFDDTLTERQNMKNNGYLKIWNCGNDAWVWTNIDNL